MILNEDDDQKSLKNVSHAEINAVNEMEKCTWIQTKWCALLLTRYYSGEACFTIRGGGREYFLMLETTNHLQSGRTCSGKWEKKYSFKHGKKAVYYQNNSVTAAQGKDKAKYYHCVHPFEISSPLKSTSTCNFKQKGERKLSLRTRRSARDGLYCRTLIIRARNRKLEDLPFPKALYVWTGCSLRSSLLHPEFFCGAPPSKH